MINNYQDFLQEASDNITYICDNNRHLVCLPYTIENLHTMARELDIDRAWYHYSNGKYHYDIPKKRIREIQLKCILVNSKGILKIIKKRRPYKRTDVLW
jgi:hypothetical protein